MKKIVLIDNDNLIHALWQRECKKHDIEINTFFSIASFCESASDFESETPIFLDSDLGDGIKGEKDGVKIFELGFSNITLQTGHDPHDLDIPNWISAVQGKRPKF